LWEKISPTVKNVQFPIDEFLLLINKKIVALATDRNNKKLTEFLKNIQNDSVKKDTHYSPTIIRMLTIIYILVLVSALDLAFDHALEYARNLDLDITNLISEYFYAVELC